MSAKELEIAGVRIGGDSPVVVIAGPCVIEDEESTLRTALRLKEVSERVGIGAIFKASYDKANRTSMHAYRGPGVDEGLRILGMVRDETGLPILTDVHTPDQVDSAARVCDVLQIPAFLCRQTDFVATVARAGCVVNIKKGQFLAPWDIVNVIEKVASTGNERILVTERGVTFGYNNLVSDMRALPLMRRFGHPVVFDATHSIQLPGGAGHASGGQREFVPHLARAAVGTGVDGVFMEVHENPDAALCDGANSLELASLEALLDTLLAIDRIVRGPQRG